MRKIGKQIIIFLLMVCLVYSITGCGKPQSVVDGIDQIEDDSTGESNDTETNPSGENAATFQKGALSDSLGMKDGKWEESFAVDAETFKEVEIHVDVQLPETDHMSVADLEINTDSSEALKTLIAKLFDDGKAGVLDEEQYPKWKLEKLIKRYENLVAAWKEAGALEEWEEESKKEDEEQLKKYKDQLLKATDDMVASTGYEENGYWGEVDGKVWELRKYEYEDEYGLHAGMVNCQEGLVTQIDASVDEMSVGTAEGDVENACTTSKEDAIRQAADYLSKMGYSEYEVKKVEPIQWSLTWYDGRPVETFVEGYTICFGRAIDGEQVSTSNYTMPVAEGYILEYYQDEEALVQFTDAGVIGFDVSCPRTLKADSVTETSLLSFDKIQSRIKECINQKAVEENLSLRGNSVGLLNLDHMDLVYLVLTGDEYTVIPAWRIYNISDGEGDAIENCILLNAIDGSEIDVLSIYCRVMSDNEWEEKFGSDE